ncbi:MAG: flavodoxin [Deltaproteobacteria bacterium RBG_16_47_11]|nr:MAG: flavodoxin [Deltaproteobacteria bacterium RBG_16_47_11]
MKIVGIACSPRKGKSTQYALATCLQAAREAVPQTETMLIELSDMKMNGCVACGKCMKVLECGQEDDFIKMIPILSAPDLAGLVIATPVYFGSMTSLGKAFLDRCVMFRRNGFLLRNKVGGVIAVGGVRNGGQELTIQAIQAAMLVQDMLVVGEGGPTSHYGATLWSGHPEGIEQDTFGLETARNLGKRVAEVAARMHR